MYWPDARLVVEVDAYSTHSSPWAFDLVIRETPELAVAQIRRRLA